MFDRRYFALPALAGTLLGATVAAFAQVGPLPAASATAVQARSAAPYVAGQQRPGQRGRHRHNRVGHALRGLGLTQAQRGQIRGFMHSYRISRKSGTPQTRAQLLARIEGVLTPDERARFETRLSRHRAKAGPAPRS